MRAGFNHEGLVETCDEMVKVEPTRLVAIENTCNVGLGTDVTGLS